MTTPPNLVLKWQRAVVAGGYLARMTRLQAKLAFALMKYADYRTGELYPTIEQLAAAVGSLNLTRVREGMNELEEMGVVATTQRGGGRGNATTRRLVIPIVDERAQETETDGVPDSADKQGQFQQQKGDTSEPETGTVLTEKGGHAPSLHPASTPRHVTPHEHTNGADVPKSPRRHRPAVKERTPEPPKQQSRGGTRAKRPKLTLDEARTLPVPLILNTPTFRATWERFLQYREERRELGTKIGTEVLLDQLVGFGPEQAIEKLNMCMANQWRGVIFKDDRKNGVINGNGKHHGKHAASSPRRIEEDLSLQ